jgi:hypothetical protein
MPRRAMSSSSASKRPKNSAKAGPITAAESPDVRAAVEMGHLHWSKAASRLVAAVRGGRQWTTPEWKAVRERLIKDSCDQCGASEGPFTLQHLSHPPTITKLMGNFAVSERSLAWAEYKERFPIAEIKEERPSCPQCGGVSIHSRLRLTPRWKCNSQSRHRTCGHEFDEPNYVQAPARKQNSRAKEHRWKNFEQDWQTLYEQRRDEYGRKAIVEALLRFERYMTGDDTSTFCRRCAFLWDMQGVRLCRTCLTNWHKLHLRACDACLHGVSYAVCAQCGRERHNTKYQTCYSCAQQRHHMVAAAVDPVIDDGRAS